MSLPDVSSAAIVPTRVASAAQARDTIPQNGAVLIGGLADEDAALAFAAELMGPAMVRLGRQFAAVKNDQDTSALRAAMSAPDERGRVRNLGMTSEHRMSAHNDGYAFGDYAPELLFLYCERPAAVGGDSFLVDGAALLDLLAADPTTTDLAEFCWTAPIDHSEPGIPQHKNVPIARRLDSGKVQVRCHDTMAPVPGPGEDRDAEFIRRWIEAVRTVRDTGPMFPAVAGEMICLDNYRVMHGRDGYRDPNRRLLSIWGWTTSAIAVSTAGLDIDQPDLAAL
jgi:hypothetical protein